MFTLSSQTRYAILALGCLASRGQQWVMARQIAQCTGISLPVLSKLLHRLVHRGLLRAKRGYRGGFALARPAEQIAMVDVLNALADEPWQHQCLLGFEHCHAGQPCPLHDLWAPLRASLIAQLSTVTLRDVADYKHRGGELLCAAARHGDQPEA